MCRYVGKMMSYPMGRPSLANTKTSIAIAEFVQAYTPVQGAQIINFDGQAAYMVPAFP
jgi:hypothetical protein